MTHRTVRRVPHRLAACASLVAALCVTVGVPSAQQTGHINAVVEKLSRGERVFGVSTYDLSLENARALARADIDYVYVDMEHGPMDFKALQTFLLGMTDKAALHESGSLQQRVAPLARLAPYGSEQTLWTVKQALDLGLMGIIFPSIDTADQAITAIRSMRYPQPRESPYMEPWGLRGYGPAAAAWHWGLSPTEYVRHADLWPLNPAGDLVAIMIIESAEAIRNIDEIAAVPGVTGFFAGRGDLSRSLGVARDAPEVEVAVERMLMACRTHDIACAITASAADMSRRIAQGFRIIGAGRAGGGLPASVDAALRAGRDVP